MAGSSTTPIDALVSGTIVACDRLPGCTVQLADGTRVAAVITREAMGCLNVVRVGDKVQLVLRSRHRPARVIEITHV